MREVQKSDHSFYCYIDGVRVAAFYGTDAGAKTDALAWASAPEAAAEVKRLSKAADDLAQELAFTRRQLEIAQEQIAAYVPIAQQAAELRAALEPLAALDAPDGCPDDESLNVFVYTVTLGDVRRAKRALGEGDK